jgi:dTDP-4-amino-4,6-dideoxygalactose transaminase
MTPKTRAIVAVHLWGWVADMDAIMDISRETGVPVIEDCSHAHGAMYKGRPLGSIGHVGVWSLQGSKPISAGEGGVLATNDQEIFERACLAGQVNRIGGMDLQGSRYEKHQPLGTGMKFRAHPLGIGIALVQLGKLAALNEGRRRYVEAVESALPTIPGISPAVSAPGSTRGGFYDFPIHYDAAAFNGLPRDEMAKRLNDRGVAAHASSYPLLHQLPLFAEGFDLFTGGRGPLIENWPGHRKGDFPVTEKMYDGLLFLPVLTDPAPGATDHVIETLKQVTAEARQG